MLHYVWVYLTAMHLLFRGFFFLQIVHFYWNPRKKPASEALVGDPKNSHFKGVASRRGAHTEE